MNTTEYQLDCLGFPPYLECHRKYFSIDNLNAFVSVFISKLISNLGFSAIQMEIDSDTEPSGPAVNYITCLMETGILHELFNQSFSSPSQTILDQRLEFLSQAINISVATELKLNGFKNIPSISNGEINIYFTWDNMEIIIQRIMPVAKQVFGAVPNEVRSYINDLIDSNL